ncbi:uncharacterized protein [Watersipora subatra]|uniref:uncharacterized protein n=1 Tax=Watersipora subatra TaxID=2589382 RepID=UPI00355B277E
MMGKSRLQVLLLALLLFSAATLFVMRNMTKQITYVVRGCPTDDPYENSRRSPEVPRDKSLQTQVTNTTMVPSTRETSTANYTMEEHFNEKVPAHVAQSISKLYHKLKANGSIINDLITTEYPVIPNVFHYVRFNQSFLKFYAMLSIKSALRINPEKVYIHTNSPPQGHFWDMIKNDPRIKVVHRDPPTSIFGKEFGWVQHGSDLARIQILREHGGIYLDNDCIVINEFERERKHHCVVSKSSEERHMGNMFMMATTDCVFMQLYEELYRLDYQRHIWYYNGGELPQYALLDQYPGIAFMADEGVAQRLISLLWNENTDVEYLQKYWSVVHLYYGHKDYTYNDTTDYNEKNIYNISNGFTKLARFILDD